MSYRMVNKKLLMKNNVWMIVTILLICITSGCNLIPNKDAVEKSENSDVELKPLSLNHADYNFKLSYSGNPQVLEKVSFKVIVMNKNNVLVNNGDVEIELGMDSMGHSSRLKTEWIKPGTYICSGTPPMEGSWQLRIHYYTINGEEIVSNIYELNIKK